MATKSTLGKTNKYSNVAETVKNSQKEEPRITAQQVVEAFQSFGFEPNQNNNNDIAYWTTKGVSEGPKLIDELYKKRTAINAQEEAAKKLEEDTLKNEAETKKTLPRLSDEELSALFDEYGIPLPDPEWARNNLPNDPVKVRAILEMQRKAMDDTFKAQSKNATSMSTPAPIQAPNPMQSFTGQGGPKPSMPLNIPGSPSDDGNPVTPFFVGDQALIKITNPTNPNAGTLWLVDKKKKVLRPILSERALENAFEDPEEAIRSITVLSSKALGPGGPLEGFTPLDGEKGLREDGTMDDIEFSPGQLQNRYGKSVDETGEKKSLAILDGILGKLNQK